MKIKQMKIDKKMKLIIALNPCAAGTVYIDPYVFNKFKTNWNATHCFVIGIFLRK